MLVFLLAACGGSVDDGVAPTDPPAEPLPEPLPELTLDKTKLLNQLTPDEKEACDYAAAADPCADAILMSGACSAVLDCENR